MVSLRFDSWAVALPVRVLVRRGKVWWGGVRSGEVWSTTEWFFLGSIPRRWLCP